MKQSEAKLDQQIRQVQARNKYLKKTIQQMRQALDDNPSTHKHDVKNGAQVNMAALKQLQVIQKNRMIAQRQLNKLKTNNLTLDELMVEAEKLQKAVNDKGEQKRNLWNQITKTKRQMHIKNRHIEDPQGSARVKAESFQLQIKVLNKKLSLLSTTSKPNVASLMNRTPSIQPVKKFKQSKQQPPPETPKQNKLVKQQLALYFNLTQSYQKKLQQLTSQIAYLQLKHKQREKEGQMIDQQIDEWISKIEQVKKGITPANYRKIVVTQKKLVKLI